MFVHLNACFHIEYYGLVCLRLVTVDMIWFRNQSKSCCCIECTWSLICFDPITQNLCQQSLILIYRRNSFAGGRRKKCVRETVYWRDDKNVLEIKSAGEMIKEYWGYKRALRLQNSTGETTKTSIISITKQNYEIYILYGTKHLK